MSVFDDLFQALPRQPARHATSDPMWRQWNAALRPAVEQAFRDGGGPVAFGPFGELRFPYFRMGNIDSLDLFGLDELVMFAFYDANRGTYRKAVDFGANIGLHSIILSRCGFEVRSFEPDPVHLKLLKDNLASNAARAEVHAAAVSFENGEAEFVRVLQNTTGNHLKGAKTDPYGGTDVFKVAVEAAAPHLEWADFAKIDIEGHEAAVLTHLPRDTWAKTDALVEVGTEANAKEIFDYFKGSEINLFAQKIGWSKVSRAEDMPASHRDGSLFMSGRAAMPWPH